VTGDWWLIGGGQASWGVSEKPFAVTVALEKKFRHLGKCSQKLSGVKITRQSYEHSLKGATKDTFVYADPPYYRESLDNKFSKLYDKPFDEEQHTHLRDVLEATPAKVMVSYDDRPEVRELYSDADKWRVVDLQWAYCGRYAKTNKQRENNHKEKKVQGKELLIMNYEPPAVPIGEAASC